jgi:O-antigen/teichoic acid export membrane protein
MLTRRIALVLRVGAVIFAVSALALLVEPSFFVKFIGVVGAEDSVSPELSWAMRMIGAVLVIVATMMPVVAAFASDRTLRQVASIMVLVCLTLSFLTVVAPGNWTLGRWGYLAAGTAFALAYLYGLQGRRRNH